MRVGSTAKFGHGLFRRALVSAALLPTRRPGVGVVGLLRTGEISKPGYGKTHADPPSPVPLAGLLFGDTERGKTPPILPR